MYLVDIKFIAHGHCCHYFEGVGFTDKMAVK